MNLSQLFENMWIDYIKMNPEAERIHGLLKRQGEDVINDHIALRTIASDKVGVDALAKLFEPFGYQERGQYHFEAKKLNAKHYECDDPKQPKIFISELLLDEFSDNLQKTLESCIEKIPPPVITSPDFLYSGTHWQVKHEVYNTLKEESEYAAWLYSMGYRPNHFTVSINHLKGFDDLVKFNDFLKKNDFQLNDSGGEIKGNPKVFLEQSSTLASMIDKDFVDGTFKVPGCYYEFALRYKTANGSLYQGFVAKSADKIFESTDKGY